MRFVARQGKPPRGVATRKPIEPDEALSVLTRHEVEFIVIGGLAAIAHGSRRLTDDLDIIVNPRVANGRRLIAALVDLEARYRLTSGRWAKLSPKADPKWIARENHLLETRAGGIDVMNRLEGVPTWKEARPRAVETEAFGLTFLVLDKDSLIRSKLVAGRDRDLSDVAELNQAE
jgi:hypothetical protein